MRVIGVDPGTAVTGFGVVERNGARLRHLGAGVVRTNARESKGARLKTVHENLSRLILEYHPDAISLERSFVATNVQSAFRLGEARAMALLAAAQNSVTLFEYAPNEVKLTVAAYGHADKSQVEFMVRKHLELSADIELVADASDALALAICHLMMARMMPSPTPLGRVLRK